MTDADRVRDALNKIGEIVRAVNCDESSHSDGQTGTNPGYGGSSGGAGAELLCTPISLPKRLILKAAEVARKINPANSPPPPPPGAGFAPMDKMQIALLTANYWGPSPRQLTVSFMENAPQNLRDRILKHMNAWTKTACISFVKTGGVGNVRISLTGQFPPGPGHWSYTGIEILSVPSNRPTMNLQDFSMNTSESEYRRVVRHETGHTLGFPHEHLRSGLVARINRQAAYQFFWQTQHWDQQTVNEQVLKSLNDNSLFGTKVDQDSIMCYHLPGSITIDGQPITGGTDINETDFKFAGLIYPRGGPSNSAAPMNVPNASPDWPESEDVDVQL